MDQATRDLTIELGEEASLEAQEEALREIAIRRKHFCCRPMKCCLCCGPRSPRWLWCTLCLLVTYGLSIPVLFFAIHFVQYPGNWEGDFPISGGYASNYFASTSDNRTLKGLAVNVPPTLDGLVAPVVFFGGNGQGMSGAAEDALWLLGNLRSGNSSLQFKLFTTAYRGYSPNSGWVSEKALRHDAMDFLDHALQVTHPKSSGGRIILGGWSMGAGVAMQLAAALPEKIAGVVLFSPWSSLREETLNIAAPLSYLLWPYVWTSEVWDSVAAMASLPPEVPVAVLSAGNDKVIPPWEHRKVFDASHAIYKWFLLTKGMQHPDLPNEINAHSSELQDWMHKAWSRIEVFGSTSAELPYRATLHNVASKRKRAFDPVGDVVARLHRWFKPLDVLSSGL